MEIAMCTLGEDYRPEELIGRRGGHFFDARWDRSPMADDIWAAERSIPANPRGGGGAGGDGGVGQPQRERGRLPPGIRLVRGDGRVWAGLLVATLQEGKASRAAGSAPMQEHSPSASRPSRSWILAKEQGEAASGPKSAFLATMSHADRTR